MTYNIGRLDRILRTIVPGNAASREAVIRDGDRQRIWPPCHPTGACRRSRYFGRGKTRSATSGAGGLRREPCLADARFAIANRRRNLGAAAVPYRPRDITGTETWVAAA